MISDSSRPSTNNSTPVMFPVKLHYILASPNPAIAWTDDGTAIRVLDKEMLIKDYLPVYFNQNSFASFRHQLTSYGFKKVEKGINVNCYYHPFFMRDYPQYMFQMQRIPPKARRDMIRGNLIQLESQSVQSDPSTHLETKPTHHSQEAIRAP